MRKAGPVCASACLLIGLLALGRPLPLLAASPRDAIQNLPTFTYTTQYTLTDPGTAGEPYTDGLYTSLDVGWATPGISLKGGINAKGSFRSSIKMSDLLNRTARSSSDSRTESFDYTLRLDKPGTFSSSYNFNRNDLWSGSTNTRGVAGLQSDNTKTFNFTLTMPNYPVLRFGSTIRDSYSPVPKLVETGSSTETANYNLSYKKDAGQVYSEYAMDMSSTQTTTLNDGVRAERSRTYTAFDAVRRMPLGQIGNLQLNYHYDEDSNSSFSRPQADVTRTSNYQLNLSGNVAHFPLEYSAWYTNFNQSPANNNTLNRVDRLLSFTFRPPVPKGKSASLRIVQQVTDTEDANSNISIQQQQAVWDYSPNARTSGNISYTNSSSTDLRVRSRTRETENLNFSLNYNIPGDRGSISGNYANGVERQPQSGSRYSTSGFNLNNYFRLGDLANMTLFFSQAYNDNSTALQLPAGNDTVAAGFVYDLSSRQGYHLNASWRNILQRQNPSGNKTGEQQLQVIVDWQPQQNWRYQLKINSNTSDFQETFAGLDHTYRSSDTINALVTYTF